MTNQEIVDRIEDAIPAQLSANVKEKILDEVFYILNNELGIDLPSRSTTNRE